MELIHIQRPEPIELLAAKIFAAGYVFECETLRTGEVSLTVTHHDRGDEWIELCANDQSVPATVDKLITGFAAKLERTRPNG